MSTEFLVALPIDEMQNGSIYAQNDPLPLHCTLMQWFELGGEFAERRISDQIEMICASFGKEKLAVVARERALFGPNDDMPVSVLARGDDLNFLHTSLLLGLAMEHAVFKELRWVGAGYRAHVADVSGRSLALGSTHACDHMALISREENKTKKVTRLYRLGRWAY